jgi:hypothetical protein
VSANARAVSSAILPSGDRSAHLSCASGTPLHVVTVVDYVVAGGAERAAVEITRRLGSDVVATLVSSRLPPDARSDRRYRGTIGALEESGVRFLGLGRSATWRAERTAGRLPPTRTCARSCTRSFPAATPSCTRTRAAGSRAAGTRPLAALAATAAWTLARPRAVARVLGHALRHYARPAHAGQDARDAFAAMQHARAVRAAAARAPLEGPSSALITGLLVVASLLATGLLAQLLRRHKTRSLS